MHCSLAWLTAKADPVKNTFMFGDIDIALAESADAFKMVPGASIQKDPIVTVIEGSEACWLFIKVDQSDLLDNLAGGFVCAAGEVLINDTIKKRWHLREPIQLKTRGIG